MRPLTVPGSKTAAQPRPAEISDSDSGLSLSDILRMVTRQWIFIVTCVLLCVVLAYVYARSLTPIYEASGSMRLDPNRAGSLGLGDLAGVGAGGTADVINTEMAIIQSDSVAIETLNLLSEEDFTSFAGAPRSQLAFPDDAVKLTRAQEGLLARFKSGLKARQVGSTQLIGVSYRSSDPQMAATIVNDAIAAYLKESFDSRYGSVAQVRKWLSTEMKTLQNQAAEAQKRLARFQENNGLLATSETSNTTLDTLKTLSVDLTRAKADRLVREAQLRAAMSGDPHVVASIFPSPTFTTLQTDQSKLYTQYAQLSSKFGENYPPLAEVKRQIAQLDKQFDGELTTLRGRVKQEYDTATVTENLLQAQYDTQLDKAYALNRQEAEYAALLSETKSTRDLYDTLEHKLQQAGVDAGLNAVNTMLVDRARAPLVPVEPNKTAILGFGLMLGLFSGIGAAFLKEAITDTIQSVDQLEHTLRHNILAVIPHMTASVAAPAEQGASNLLVSPTLVSYHTPLSRGSEAFRNLRNGLLLSNDQLKTILITSTIASEGKSNTAANYGVVLAHFGAKVLMIDADLRRPMLHTLFGLDNVQGLSNLILGEDSPDLLRKPLPELPNLSVLTAGKRTPLPAEMLSSNRLRDLLEHWEKEFDYILLDSAPLLVVSDSLPLASWVDACILVVRYNQTPNSALRRVRAILARTQAYSAGVVLNDMPSAGVGYGKYGNGNGYYQ